MSIIHFFPEIGCLGPSSEGVTTDLPDLSSIGFLKQVKSLRVTGNPCVVFKEKEFKGLFQLYREGDHDAVGEFPNNISSVRVVKGGLEDPEITVCEKPNYGGKHVILTSPAPNLHHYKMSNMISSHQVKKGAWRIYEEEDYEGACILALAGDNLADYSSIYFAKIANSLKPYKV